MTAEQARSIAEEAARTLQQSAQPEQDCRRIVQGLWFSFRGTAYAASVAKLCKNLEAQARVLQARLERSRSGFTPKPALPEVVTSDPFRTPEAARALGTLFTIDTRSWGRR